MTLPTLIRSFAAAALFVTLIGCGGKPEPTKPGDTKPGDPKPGDPKPGPTPPGGGGTTTPPAPTGPQYIGPTDPIQLAAEKFQKDLRDGTVGPDRLTTNFLKVIGRPAVFDDDKKKGYSADAAGSWVKRVGAGLPGVGAPAGFAGNGVAVFTTPLVGTGRITMRFAQADGTWKADWVQFAVVKADEPRKPETGDEPFQNFAVQGFLDALIGGNGAMGKDDRVLLLGAVMSPKLKKAWAEPFGSDTTDGFDFNRGRLGAKAVEQGDGIEAYSFAPAGADAYKVEVTRGGAKKPFAVKLVKGTAPGEWLVDEFNPQ